MFGLLFTLLFVSIMLFVFGKKRWGEILALFTLALGALLFFFHMTDPLMVSL